MKYLPLNARQRSINQPIAASGLTMVIHWVWGYLCVVYFYLVYFLC